MTELLGYLQTGKLHWLTVPLYAIVALPLIVATGLAAAGASWWVLPLWVVAVLGFAQLVWFKQLPHEKARLASAKAALAAAKPDQAISISRRPLRLGGTGYELDRASALLRQSNTQGQHLDHMIGVAYFNLLLRQDFTEAAHWKQQIDAHKPALDHFAGWLREHHAYVCAALRAPAAPLQGAHPCTG